MKTKTFLLLFLFIYNFCVVAVQIPYAKNSLTDKIVSADKAPKTGLFKCLECDADLILRRGQIKQAHFAHKADSNSTCSGGVETYEHLLAKQLLAEHLDEWTFVHECMDCANPQDTLGPFLVNNGYKAQEEYAYDKYRVDIMVLKNNVENLAVEVRHTHAVEDEKREFFNACNLNMIEVDAQQIIEAYQDQSFTAVILKQVCCKNCERKKMRPCLDCSLESKKWFFPKDLEKIVPPIGHKFKKAFVCQKCKAFCPLCNSITTKGQLAKHKSCVLCNKNVQEWQFNFDQAMSSQNLVTMRSLINKAPPSLNKLDIKNKYKKVEQELEGAKIEQHERSLALEKQRKENMIEQWKSQVWQAINDKDCDKMRKLLKTVPGNAEFEEQELITKELAVCEIEEEKIIEQEAQKIVAQKKVCLEANYMKHAEELQRYGAQWYGGNKWSVPIKNIQVCAQWLKHSEKLIPRVQALQKEEKVTYASNKRKNPPPIEPVAKKQRITSFFLKK